ncbi:hypothetical protein PhaeoP75_00654 [Phaeobacter gallaeciensis]|uniref:DUF3305 domain-containing protein n=2 Tax=Phaeobacter gallaeciensis TaxID=60890 RepID=A0AAC9Z680_9RHOB|nr:hypothetical protein Gal_00657 [Phaeobacter gallaeciensis DSM 26640]ATE91708.1 hypothetical protein PhaeoP11_00653 [Phaeobacter gallaeciensis]ATE98468.1 hypothetical protein PhaeoP73_03191 [Phaeobacter gallaeciensis]ATF00324.1 hypothetical protein PhaeoP75_00654 [Phaeobacter gallaeciensis]ATF04756.1 hypothetical protein PhaeoP63_00654 [Phaeobacter gallaeciensis]
MAETIDPNAKTCVMPLGVVVRRQPGVTRWARWSWRVTSVLPGAAPADWQLLREVDEICEFHAATLPLELHRSEAEAYLHGLTAEPPCIYVVLREGTSEERPLDVLLVTASPYEAQDYADNGEDLVEKVPMPDGLVAWIRDFAQLHFHDEPFKKRRRDRVKTNATEDGIGDPRISQLTDVYRSPTLKKARLS